MNKIFSTLLMVFLIAGIGYSQTTVHLPSVKDNTLFENGTGALSNGAGPSMIAGKTNSSALLRRALVQFDVSTIPSNATITSVKLKLKVVKTSSGPKMVAVHTALADWGEGTSNDGSGVGSGNGATATTNDATWIHRFHNTSNWTTAGGDFTPTASATLSVNAVGSFYTWTSAGLMSDVQNWVNGTATNNGWVLVGDEGSNKTTKHFATKEEVVMADRPDLEVTYTVPAPADIVITEINYNVPGLDSLEYVELYNNGATAVNLNNWSFSEGVSYTFPNITINAGAYLLIAGDSVAMQNAYGVTAYEWSSNSALGNGGEDITIVDANGMTIDSVDYDDGGAWPNTPDGSGPSLELCDPSADNNDPANWIASFTVVGANVMINGSPIFGSPGVANNCVVPLPPIVTNPYPYKTIDIVTTNDMNGVADSLNKKFELRGVVHSPDYDGNAGYSFSFIDLTGGINGFSFNDIAGYVVTEGDSLHIKGEIKQFNGLTEIVPDSIFVISSGNMLHEPSVELNLGESEEMELIRFNGMWMVDPAQWTPGGSGFNVDITNGSDTMTMRIDTDMGIMTAPTGYFHVIGVGGQFDNSNPYTEGYQILPRKQSDIIPIPVLTNSLILTGLLDGPSSNPKAMEIYVVNNIPDLSIYGFGIANNGGGTDGQEYTFPAVSANAGDIIYLANDTASFSAFTGKYAAFQTGTITFNGDDAIQIYEHFVTIDIYGLLNVHGDGQPWEYEDSWAYRNCSTGPDGVVFQLNDWSVAPKNNFDNQTSNATSPVPMPIGTYDPNCPAVLDAKDDMVMVQYNTPTNFMPLNNDNIPNILTGGSIVQNTSNGTTTLNLISTMATYTPNNNYCGTDTARYAICDALGCDTAMIVFTIACPLPIYDIAQVRGVDADGVADSLNVFCELRGTVYGVDLRGGTGLSFTIIDGTGGMNVFNFDDVNAYTVTEGDSIHVQGEIIQFNGLTELDVDSIHVAGTGTLKAPTVVTDLGETTESDLVQFTSVTLVDATQWTNAGSGFNVDITDGTNTFAMRIDSDCDLFGTMAPVGAFKVTGIGGQYDASSPYTEGYQLFPRYIADIELINNTNQVNLEGQIRFFPNPVREQLNIVSDIDLTMIRVSNVLGQEVMTVNTPNQTSNLDVAHLTNGVYIITFVTENATWSAQFIKQ